MSREERDELRRQHAVHVARHRPEEAVLGEGGRARRHRGAARAQLDEGALERVEQQVDVEEPLHVLLRQDEHDASS